MGGKGEGGEREGRGRGEGGEREGRGRQGRGGLNLCELTKWVQPLHSAHKVSFPATNTKREVTGLTLLAILCACIHTCRCTW